MYSKSFSGAGENLNIPPDYCGNAVHSAPPPPPPDCPPPPPPKPHGVRFGRHGDEALVSGLNDLNAVYRELPVQRD